MVPMDYERLVKTISKTSGLELSDVEQKVEAKQQKISGLISREGAAQIVAAELGVTFENEKLKISELSPDMRNVSLIGKVINLFPVRTFTKNGKESKVVNFIIADETSNTRVVLWDTKHISLIEEGKIEVGSIVELSNAGVREGEIHLGGFSEIKLSGEPLGEVRTDKIVEEKKIYDFKTSNNVSVRAFIVQAFDPKFFDVCPECKKKVIIENDSFVCGTHGKVPNERRALLNLVLDDGTESIRAVFFHDSLKELGITDLENADSINLQKENLLGKEKLFSGTVRMNKFFNNNELIVDNVRDINVDELISKLESK